MRVEPTWAVHILYQMMVVPVSKRARISMCCSVSSFQVTLLAPIFQDNSRSDATYTYVLTKISH